VSLAPLLEKIRPAVVSVRGRGGGPVRLERLPFRVPMQEMPQPQGVGSGFVLTADGLVVTNHHVVDGRDTLEVELDDGRVFTAKVVGTDAPTDVALLRLEGAKGLPTVALGASDKLRVGDWVVAIGAPMGLQQSVSAGIVAGKGRGNLGLYRESFVDFLQVDAALAPGNSGGPLFNLAGEVVGVNTAVGAFVPGRAPGFAIPIDQVKRVVPQLQATGKVARGWLGIAAREVEPTATGAKTRGAAVGEVWPDTPGGRAGLQVGDRITAIDGKELEDFEDLRSRIADLPPGTKLRLEVDRAGKTLNLGATLGERPEAERLDALARGGGSGEDLFGGGPPRLGADVESTRAGVVLRRVEPQGLAARLGLQPGDVLQRVNDLEIRTPADIVRALERDRHRTAVEVRRGRRSHTAIVERR
jgi:serine protease Do